MKPNSQESVMNALKKENPTKKKYLIGGLFFHQRLKSYSLYKKK